MAMKCKRDIMNVAGRSTSGSRRVRITRADYEFISKVGRFVDTVTESPLRWDVNNRPGPCDDCSDHIRPDKRNRHGKAQKVFRLLVEFGSDTIDVDLLKPQIQPWPHMEKAAERQ